MSWRAGTTYDDFKIEVASVFGDTCIVFYGQRDAINKGPLIYATNGFFTLYLELAALPENFLYDFKNTKQLSGAATITWG